MNTTAVIKEIEKKYDILGDFGTGGSSAGSLLVKGKHSGTRYVLKFSTWEGIGSSGMPWLKAQAKRLIELKNLKKVNLKDKIPDVHDEFFSRSLFYYVMDFFKDSLPVSTYHFRNSRDGLKDFVLDIRKIIQILSDLYSIKQVLPPKDFIVRSHILRIKNRISLLTSRNSQTYEKIIKDKQIRLSSKYVFKDLTYLFRDLFRLDSIVINKKPYLNVYKILLKINNERLIHTLMPDLVPIYYHGDSTLRNFLKCRDGSIKMIDVRGLDLPKSTVSTIDIAYEMGKLMRSFFLEVVRNDNFIISAVKRESRFEFNFKFDDTKAVKKFLKIRDEFPEILRKSMRDNKIIMREKDLIKRTYFAEAAHFLADAVNRMESDPTGKQTLAYFLIGLKLFGNFLKRWRT